MKQLDDGDEDEDVLFDEGGLLRDGKRWRVPLRMMDGVQRAIGSHAAGQLNIRTIDSVGHRPGFLADARSVADRQRVYDEYDAAASNAWKPGSPAVPDRPRSGRQDDTRDAREAAYADYEGYIRDLWRGAGR